MIGSPPSSSGVFQNRSTLVGELGWVSRLVGLSGTSAFATWVSKYSNGNRDIPKSSKNRIFRVVVVLRISLLEPCA